MMSEALTETEATSDLHARGIFRMAPGLWCDKSVPDFIAVDETQDNAVAVRAALERSNMLPPRTQGE